VGEPFLQRLDLHSQSHNLDVLQISQRRTFIEGARQLAQLQFPFGNGAFRFTSGGSLDSQLFLERAQLVAQRVELDLVSINRVVLYFELGLADICGT
jgi:hypothetical protein